MSETKENLCPDCGHHVSIHINERHRALQNRYNPYDFTMCHESTYTKCPCTRTYESLVGEKDMDELVVAMKEARDRYFAKPEPSLQLLVIDMGDSCLVKVEKGKHCDVQFGDADDRNDIVYSPIPTVIWASFTELREALDGDVKPVPRIERGNDGSYRLFDCNDKFGHELCEDAFRVYQETVGKPLPIYEGGKWEDLLPLPNMGIGWELPIGVWRYKR